jgi:hypothetical protein
MPATIRDRTIDWPLWWFAALERAVELGDHAAAAEAQRELERLGVRVNYGHPRLRTQKVVASAEGRRDE